MKQHIIKQSVFLGAILGLSFIFSATAFAATPIVTSAKITGPNTVTIVYSVPVNTTLNDYGTFTGALSGTSLTSVSGSGSNVITLTFSGGTFAANATGGLTIASTVTAISDGSALGGGPYSVTDGQAPMLASFSMSSNLANGNTATAGDTLTVTFNTNENIYSPTMTIGTTNVSVNGSGTGPYTGSYTMSSADTPNLVPVSIQFTDTAGNQGSGSFTLGGGTGPHIVSVTSDANTTGSLGTGGVIDFVATLATPAPGAYVTGSYNGIPLSWTTNNGGATYTATYTVQGGNVNTYSPLQISGVTVRDSSGNVSLPASGTDVQKTINSNSFIISEIQPVPSTVTTNTPQYAFSTPQDGTITFGGDCSSLNESAEEGTNYITFNALPNGLHNNCTVQVTDNGGYASNILSLTPFTVEASNNTVLTNTESNTNATYPAGCTSSTGYSITTGILCSSGEVVSSSISPAQPITPVTTTTTTSAIDSYKFYNPLNVGSSGADVTALQQRLTAEGVYSGPITGYYGDLTQAAVEKYQGIHGLEELGNVGPGTRSDLNSGL